MRSTNANPDHERLMGDTIRRDEVDDFELDGTRSDNGSDLVGSEDDILGILRQA